MLILQAEASFTPSFPGNSVSAFLQHWKAAAILQWGRGCSAAGGEELCGGAPGLSGMEGELGQGCSPRALCFETGGVRGGTCRFPEVHPALNLSPLAVGVDL